MPDRTKADIEDFKPPVKLKLAALWTALMFCYVYGDFFGLFVPGRLSKMNTGLIGPLGEATPMILVGVAAMMAIPSLMIFLSLVLPPVVNRWANLVLGFAYAGIMILTMLPGAPMFYLFLGGIEVALTLLIVWYAWRWPRRTA